LLKFAFEDLDIHRIWATTDESIKDSIILLKNLHFYHKGIITDFYLYKNKLKFQG